MKSPFPGMDPYLESRWPGVHGSLITLITEYLQPQLPRDLRARGEERVFLEDSNDGSVAAEYRPDVAVIDLGRQHRPADSPELASTATVEPIRIQYRNDPEIERFIHIIDVANGNHVITAIEVLSPSNKRPGRINEDYRQKLLDYEQAHVNIVEIDLLRAPSRDELRVSEGHIPESRRTPYMICVHDARQPNEWLAYPVSLRVPIPSIPIPLRPHDASVTLALQPLIERAYIIGGHDDIDYSKPPLPPLAPGDAAWAKTLLDASSRS